jgi:hypothetical protein
MKTTLRTPAIMGAVSILLLLANCSKEKDPVPADLILGNWAINTATVTIKVGSQSMLDYLIDEGLSRGEAQDIVDAYGDNYVDVDGSMEIKKDGTYSWSASGSNSTGTWELSSDGKTLTFDKLDYPLVFTITTLTSRNLSMTVSDSETYEDITIIVHVEIELTK